LDVTARAATCTSLEHWRDPEECLRARMGFGRDEAGATPTGRTSVPAIHGDGTLSCPPLYNSASVDEGIELSSLEHSVKHHVLRILERSLRGPSRATSCEPQDTFRTDSIRESPCPSPPPLPPPPQQFLERASSPQSSLCPSPILRGCMEELNLGVSVRTCQSRCGSSSAVLELVIDHSQDCSKAAGCVCFPTPEDAEARLLAYFGRHTLLRLAAKQPTVRVFLEPLSGHDDNQRLQV